MVALKRWIERRRYRRLVARMAGPRLLRAFAATHPEALVVEIGANDGHAYDQLGPLLAEHPWRALLVEPVPHVFARLQTRHADNPRVACENVAVAATNGRLPFFHFAEAAPAERAALPAEYDALGSFSRETVLSHAPELEHRLVETSVPTVTFDALLDRHGAGRVDLLAIDTEGHDWEILRTVDLAAHRPRLILYEHFHLTPADRAAARARLHEHGYESLEEGLDTWALGPGPADALTAAFRAASPALPGMSRHDG